MMHGDSQVSEVCTASSMWKTHIAIEPASFDDHDVWSYRDLQRLCMRVGLSGGGARATLVRRLRTYHRSRSERELAEVRSHEAAWPMNVCGQNLHLVDVNVTAKGPRSPSASPTKVGRGSLRSPPPPSASSSAAAAAAAARGNNASPKRSPVLSPGNARPGSAAAALRRGASSPNRARMSPKQLVASPDENGNFPQRSVRVQAKFLSPLKKRKALHDSVDGSPRPVLKARSLVGGEHHDRARARNATPRFAAAAPPAAPAQGATPTKLQLAAQAVFSPFHAAADWAAGASGTDLADKPPMSPPMKQRSTPLKGPRSDMKIMFSPFNEIKMMPHRLQQQPGER